MPHRRATGRRTTGIFRRARPYQIFPDAGRCRRPAPPDRRHPVYPVVLDHRPPPRLRRRFLGPPRRGRSRQAPRPPLRRCVLYSPTPLGHALLATTAPRDPQGRCTNTESGASTHPAAATDTRRTNAPPSPPPPLPPRRIAGRSRFDSPPPPNQPNRGDLAAGKQLKLAAINPPWRAHNRRQRPIWIPNSPQSTPPTSSWRITGRRTLQLATISPCRDIVANYRATHQPVRGSNSLLLLLRPVRPMAGRRHTQNGDGLPGRDAGPAAAAGPSRSAGRSTGPRSCRPIGWHEIMQPDRLGRDHAGRPAGPRSSRPTGWPGTIQADRLARDHAGRQGLSAGSPGRIRRPGPRGPRAGPRGSRRRAPGCPRPGRGRLRGGRPATSRRRWRRRWSR